MTLFLTEADAGPICSECEGELEWVECSECGGDGMGDHDCGEDCCACLFPEPNVRCEMCAGVGGWIFCPNPDCTTGVIEF